MDSRAMRRTARFGLLAALCLAGAPASASTLYANDYPGVATLFEMDQGDGTASAIGSVGKDNIGDLTSDTRLGSETLWGVRIGGTDRPGELITIDPATGAEIDSVNITIPAGAAHPGYMTSIAFDPVSGVLYGNTAVGYGAPFDALYSIDPLSGLATFIGRITFQNVYALGFDQAGNLFGVADTTNQLIGISVLTGNGALIADLQVGLAFDLASRPEDDVMFLADSGTNSLYTIDTGDGALTLVGDYGATHNLVGLAFSAIPEPGTLLLLSLGLPLLVRRRARR